MLCCLLIGSRFCQYRLPQLIILWSPLITRRNSATFKLPKSPRSQFFLRFFKVKIEFPYAIICLMSIFLDFFLLWYLYTLLIQIVTMITDSISPLNKQLNYLSSTAIAIDVGNIVSHEHSDASRRSARQNVTEARFWLWLAAKLEGSLILITRSGMQDCYKSRWHLIISRKEL